MKIIKMKIMI